VGEDSRDRESLEYGNLMGRKFELCFDGSVVTGE
jgi:hypothetical protein